MNCSEEIMSIIHKLYEMIETNSNLIIKCAIETQNNFYYGTFNFDNQGVPNTDCLVLKDVLLSEKFIDNQITKLKESCIKFDGIKVFSYSIHEPKID